MYLEVVGAARPDGQRTRRGDLEVVALDAYRDRAHTAELRDIDDARGAAPPRMQDVESAEACGRERLHGLGGGEVAPAVAADAIPRPDIRGAAARQHHADRYVLGDHDQVADGIGADCRETELTGDVAAEPEPGEAVARACSYLQSAALAAYDLELAGRLGMHRDDQAVLQERIRAPDDIALCVRCGRYQSECDEGDEVLHARSS